MINEATKIARQAFENLEAGSYKDAVQLYRQALSMTDAYEADLWQMHGEFACALERLGDLAGSREQREYALEAALHDARTEDCPAVAVARYFLGDLLLKLGDPNSALATIDPSFCGTCAEAPLRTVEAIAHWQLGSYVEARASAQKAIDCSRSEAQRNSIMQQLQFVRENG